MLFESLFPNLDQISVKYGFPDQCKRKKSSQKEVKR